MRLACWEDFESPDGLYWPAYHDYAFFSERASYLSQRFPGGRVLVLGAGWGFTVEHALECGLDVWGAELSEYALGRAQECVSAETRSRLVAADATSFTSMAWVRGKRWDAVVSEDIAPMLAISEIEAMCAVARALSDTVLHWVTPRSAWVAPHPSIVTSLSADEWQALLAPDELLGVV